MILRKLLVLHQFLTLPLIRLLIIFEVIYVLIYLFWRDIS